MTTSLFLEQHQLQGVWGRAAHPSGERDGYPLGVEPTRNLLQCNTFGREGQRQTTSQLLVPSREREDPVTS
jgi:hypothetical protein